MSTIRLVVFDLGGVVVRHCRSWAEGCAAAGVEVRGDCLCAEAVAGRRRWTREFQRGLVQEEAFYAGMAEAAGGMYSAADIERIHTLWLQDEYAGMAGVVAELLERANSEQRTANRSGKTNGALLGVGVLSNTNAAHWRLLADARRYPAVSLLVNGLGGRGNPLAHASHLMRLAKPDPAIYVEYQRRAGVGAGEILFLEDMPENVAAARAAGWEAVRIDWEKETEGQVRGVLGEYGVLGR